ncbi:Polyribonucleotide nucleotidyltransferase [Parasponia andersonii]|uniref:Polyribonucleotide nucleotidyltransferase n=1 Tax=Parasponia andersonii TaxID=3476 RepID=A0A2P5BJ51_PARAD|nr:Polyribonucleotide nucleotidyltransferase [Parasponia andersonii]
MEPGGGGYGGRKRRRFDAANAGFKKFKPEMDSLSTGIGSKSKPCTKFFSTSGCPFGEGCHFSHYVPGGFQAVSQMINIAGSPALPPVRNPAVPPSFPDGSSPPAVKTRLCNKYNSAEGCKFGDKCHFAHGEWELGRPTAPSYEDQRALGPFLGRLGGRIEPPPHSHALAASFGASSTAKISVDASLSGAIIGKHGVNSKQICRVTGAKLYVKDHESDPNLKYIELEGTFDQINQASAMVRELILNVGSAKEKHGKNFFGTGHPGAAGNFKTKICEKFTKGSCAFGDRCHFAHGAEELRKSGI